MDFDCVSTAQYFLYYGRMHDITERLMTILCWEAYMENRRLSHFSTEMERRKAKAVPRASSQALIRVNFLLRQLINFVLVSRNSLPLQLVNVKALNS